MRNFRRLIIASKSTTERCKKYRQKHKGEKKEKHAFRKKTTSNYINLIIDWLQKKFPSQFNNYPMFYTWSDSCASQFWSRFVFALMTHFNLDYTVQLYYNENNHGMGPMEGVGRIIKNMIFQHVKQNKMCE